MFDLYLVSALGNHGDYNNWYQSLSDSNPRRRCDTGDVAPFRCPFGDWKEKASFWRHYRRSQRRYLEERWWHHFWCLGKTLWRCFGTAACDSSDVVGVPYDADWRRDTNVAQMSFWRCSLASNVVKASFKDCFGDERSLHHRCLWLLIKHPVDFPLFLASNAIPSVVSPTREAYNSVLGIRLAIKEDDVVLASFGGCRRPFWHRCRCCLAVGTTTGVIAMLVLLPTSFGIVCPLSS